MLKIKLKMTDNIVDFVPAKKMYESDWFDTIDLKICPDIRELGDSVVYVDGYYWIQNISKRSIEIIRETRKFFVSHFFYYKKRKFEVIVDNLYRYKYGFNSSAFKLLNDETYNFFLNSKVYCLFDTRLKKLIVDVEFKEFIPSCFNLSHKQNLLAIYGSVRDPIDFIYTNRIYSVRLYELLTGKLIDEKIISNKKNCYYLHDQYRGKYGYDGNNPQRYIEFSDNSRMLRIEEIVDNHLTAHIFELIVE